MASPSCPDPARAPSQVEFEPQRQGSEKPPCGGTDLPRPSLVGGTTDPVAFLDAPGVSARVLFDAVSRVLGRMSDGAILTVYTDDPNAPHLAADWAAGRGVELLAVIPHDGRPGSTLTFRRSTHGTGPEPTDPPRS